MLHFSWRQLCLDPVRTALTTFAVGAVISVIMILNGFEQGQYRQLERVVLNRQADLVATQTGVTNFVAVRSSIPQLARGQIEEVDGVVEAHPMTAIPIIYTKDNKRTPVYVLIYDTSGGPTSVVRGRGLIDGRDIIVDESLVKKYDIQLGDKFAVTDFEFTVVGITREAAFMMPFAFINYDGMIDLFLESEIAPDLSTFPLLSYMLIELASDADRQEVTRQIETRVPSVDVMAPRQLALRDANLGRVIFGPIIGVLVAIGYVIGLVVVGLISYADVSVVASKALPF